LNYIKRPIHFVKQYLHFIELRLDFVHTETGTPFTAAPWELTLFNRSIILLRRGFTLLMADSMIFT